MINGKPGDRVGAISHSDQGKVFFFGYGAFKGYEVPPPGITFMGIDLNEIKHENPRIDLDNGKTVWGCECWWGPEDLVKKMLEGREIILVDMDEARKKKNGQT